MPLTLPILGMVVLIGALVLLGQMPADRPPDPPKNPVESVEAP